jgi:hypothetical protein
MEAALENYAEGHNIKYEILDKEIQEPINKFYK